MARLQDLMKQQPDNGWISMAELDALEAAQRGQSPMINNGSLENIGPGQGYIQRTGGQRIDLQPQYPGPKDLPLDYANPIDVMGSRGFRLKGDSNRVLLNDGRMVTLDAGNVAAQQAARQKQEAAQLDMDVKRQQLESAKGGEWQIADKSGVMINKRTGEIKKIPASAGGISPDQWKYDAGSDTWVAPPSAENPEGKVTVPASRTNAAKSLEYVAEQFSPVIEKTPQGGFLGIKGQAGKVTNSQEARRFDNLREQLSTELRTLFRIPGEGALSDREQAQYGVQLPDVRNDKEINKQILADIRARASLRVGGGRQQTQQAPDQLMQEAEQAIARGAPRDAVMQRLQERLRGQ